MLLAAREVPWLAPVGLLLWLIAAGFALGGQHLFAQSRAIDAGRVLLVAAALVGLAGIVLLDRVSPAPRPAPPAVVFEPWQWRSKRRIAAIALIVTGAAASFVTIPILQTWHSEPAAIALWLTGIVAVLTGAALGARNPIRPRRPSRAAWIEIGLVVGILAVALALRLPSLGSIPANVHGDEAAIGLEARRIMDGGTLFSFGWYDVPSLSFAIPAATMSLFGDDLLGLRLASVLQGVLAVLLLYLLVRRLFGMRSALLASALLSVAQWDIHFSRQGSHYMQAQLATLLVLYFVVRAIDTHRALDWVCAGLACGLCLEVYYAARLAPLLAGLVLLHTALTRRKFLRGQWPGLAALVLGFAVFLAPMWPAARVSPQAFGSRTGQVSLLSGSNLRHEREAYGVDSSLDVLRIHAQRTLEAFNRTGETSLQYGRRGALLDFWTAALLPLALLAVFARVAERQYFLLAAWIVLTLIIGSVLTIDAPFAPRLVALIPALLVLPALALDAAWRGITTAFGRSGSLAFGVVVVLLLALALTSNSRGYFDRYVNREQPRDFHTELAYYLRSTGTAYRYYLIGVDGPSLRYDTPHFLAPDIEGTDVGSRPLALPIRDVPRGKGLVFIVESGAPDADARLGAIDHVYPGARADLHRSKLGVALFATRQVSASQAWRVSGRGAPA